MTRPTRPPRKPPARALATNSTDEAPVEDPTKRTFTVGQVLTVAVGDLEVHQIFCSYAEFLDVVGYLLNDVPSLEGDPLADPPIPPLAEVVAEQARPAVLEQHPGLADVKPPAPLAPDTAVLAWLVEQEAEFGARLPLQPVEARAR